MKKKKKHSFNFISICMIFMVVATLSIVMWVQGQALKEKIQEYEIRQQQLENMISEEEQREQELAERKKYIQTKKYIEEIAKEKFGLLYEDEIMLKPVK